jgi:hypothetical protein
VQVDCRSITGDTARQRRMSRVGHPEQVAAYLAK